MAQKMLIVTIIAGTANQGLGETTMAPSVSANGLFVTIWGTMRGGGPWVGTHIRYCMIIPSSIWCPCGEGFRHKCSWRACAQHYH